MLLEEFHVSVSAPGRLPDARYVAMRRTITSPAFRARLRRAVRDLLKHYPSLQKVRCTVSW
jgi:hypothetical protein